MNGLRDELLARARLAADEHRRVRAGDLRDGLVHALHRAAVADDVREVVALAQLLLEARVLGDEPPVLRGHEPLHLHGLADHRRDDAEELGRPLVVAGRPRTSDTRPAPRPAAGRSTMGTQQKLRSSADVRRMPSCWASAGFEAQPRHDDLLAALGDLADDARAQGLLVDGRPCPGPRPLRPAFPATPCRPSRTRLPTASWCRDKVSNTSCKRRAQVERARERLADLEQRGQLLEFA